LDLKEDRFDLHTEMTFDLDSVAAQRNEATSRADEHDLQWLEARIKVGLFAFSSQIYFLDS
jgi:hypothetical protein